MRAFQVAFVVVGMVPCLAWPCSGPTCDAMVMAVPSGGVVPANAPVVGVQDSMFSDVLWDGGVELQLGHVTGVVLQRDGAVQPALPVSALEGSFVASPGFVPGEVWELSSMGQSACSTRSVFTVGPSVPLPTTSATVALDSFHVSEVWSGCGGAEGVLQFATLKILPTQEMVPWLGLARWELEVDGENWATSRYGSVSASGVTGQPVDQHDTHGLHVQCARRLDGGAGVDDRLGRGVHVVRLLARIAGVPQPISSNTLTLSFDCTTDNWDAGSPPGDGGCIDDVDAGIYCPDTVDAGGHDADSGRRKVWGCSSASTELALGWLAVWLVRRTVRRVAL